METLIILIVMFARQLIISPLAGFLEELYVNKVHPPKNALRSDLGSLDELMASIMEKGLLQPVIVRPTEDGFEIVAGNRRLEACRRLGMRRIAGHVLELDDKEAFEVSIIENVQHNTLSPIDEAKAFKRYVNEYGYGAISELARRIGKSHSYVCRRLGFLGLPRRIQLELVRGRTSCSVAQELLPLEAEQRRNIAELIAKGKITRSEVREIIDQLRSAHIPYETNSIPQFSYYSIQEKRAKVIDRVLARYIASLKVCMMKFDDAIKFVDDQEWYVREILIENRMLVHSQIDSLMKLKRRTHHLPMPTM